MEKAFQLKQEINRYGPGIFIGLLSIIFSLSYASIIFSGSLAPYLASGLGAALFSCIILSLFITYNSHIPDVIVQPQHVVCALLGIMASDIAATLNTNGLSYQILPTTIALIACSSILMGASFLALGVFKCGRLIRYIPFPVIGGVIAGIGWVIILKSLTIMTDIPLTYQTIWNPQILTFLAPGICIGIFFYIFSKRWPLYGISLVIALSLLVFYAAFFLLGKPVTADWLIHPIPSGHLWPPLGISDFSLINWSLIAHKAGHMGAMILSSVVYYLLTTSGLEVVTEQDLDIDWELRVSGIGNVLTGVGAGLPGFQTLMLSAFNHRLGVKSHVGIICALFGALFLLFNISFLNYLPKPVLGGLVFFFGLSLFIEWAYQSKEKISPLDYILVLLITVAIAFLGFIPGVIIGILITALKFIVSYSQINVIKYALTGTEFQSNVDRIVSQQIFLHKKGEQIYIIKLQGYIFFGTAYKLIQQIKTQLLKTHVDDIKFVVMDFKLVTGVDSSTVFSFIKLDQFAHSHHITLVFTDVNEDIGYQLKRGGFVTESDDRFRFFSNLDLGVEWCENKILAAEALPSEKLSLPKSFVDMRPYLDKLYLPAGVIFIHQGDQSNEIYLIESGQVTILLDLPNKKQVRLRTMHAGVLVGELGFYLGVPRSTSVITDEPTVLYRLKKSTLEKLQKEQPELISSFHQYVTLILAERLVNTTKTMQLLIE